MFRFPNIEPLWGSSLFHPYKELAGGIGEYRLPVNTQGGSSNGITLGVCDPAPNHVFAQCETRSSFGRRQAAGISMQVASDDRTAVLQFVAVNHAINIQNQPVCPFRDRAVGIHPGQRINFNRVQWLVIPQLVE